MTNVPVVEVEDFVDEGPTVWAEYRPAAGCVVLRERGPAVPARVRLANLACRLGSTRSAVLRPTGDAASVHDVRPRPRGAVDRRGVVILSTTFEALPLHTDGYNAPSPPQVVALQVAATGSGAECTSLVLGIDDVVTELSGPTIEALSGSVFPVFEGTVALLAITADGLWHARINLYELEQHRRLGTGVDRLHARHLAAVDDLRTLLDRLAGEPATEVALRAGDVLLLDNRRTLHGRRRLRRSQRERLLHRMWID